MTFSPLRKGSRNNARGIRYTSESLPDACSVEDPSKVHSGQSVTDKGCLVRVFALPRTVPLASSQMYLFRVSGKVLHHGVVVACVYGDVMFVFDWPLIPVRGVMIRRAL